jgi:hypothetical protein
VKEMDILDLYWWILNLGDIAFLPILILIPNLAKVDENFMKKIFPLILLYVGILGSLSFLPILLCFYLLPFVISIFLFISYLIFLVVLYYCYIKTKGENEKT